MDVLDPIRRGAGEFFDSLVDGWEWLKERSASALTRFRPTDDARDLDLPADFRRDGWALLASNLSETDDELVLRMETPGLDEKSLSVFCDAGQLVVQGEKHVERETSRARYHLIESAFGAFERRFHLPCPVDSDRARAQYRRGVLTVRLPKTDAAKRRRIRVHSA